MTGKLLLAYAISQVLIRGFAPDIPMPIRR